jgi:hypothetical protein
MAALKWASSDFDVFTLDDTGNYIDNRYETVRRAFVWAYLRFHPARPRVLTDIQVLTGGRSHHCIRMATNRLKPVFDTTVPHLCLWHHAPVEWMMAHAKQRLWRPTAADLADARRTHG